MIPSLICVGVGVGVVVLFLCFLSLLVRAMLLVVDFW